MVGRWQRYGLTDLDLVEIGVLPKIVRHRAFAQWQESDYEVPFAVTAGKSAATIKLVYKDSTNGTISDFFYKVFSYVLNDNS